MFTSKRHCVPSGKCLTLTSSRFTLIISFNHSFVKFFVRIHPKCLNASNNSNPTRYSSTTEQDAHNTPEIAPTVKQVYSKVSKEKCEQCTSNSAFHIHLIFVVVMAGAVWVMYESCYIVTTMPLRSEHNVCVSIHSESFPIDNCLIDICTALFPSVHGVRCKSKAGSVATTEYYYQQHRKDKN